MVVNLVSELLNNTYMKQLLKSLNGLMFILALSFAVSSCDKEKISDPEIILDNEVLSVAAEGGNYNMGYVIENPMQGAELKAECSEEWLTITEVTGENIVFSVEINPSGDSSREAVVNLTYLNVQASFRVVQPATEISGAFAIAIAVNNVSDVSVNATFTPTDLESEYYYTAVAKADFDAADSEESVIEDLVAKLDEMSVEYGLSLADYLKDYALVTGKQTKDIVGLAADTDYYVIAFGMKQSAEATTGIYKTEIRTAKPADPSAVTFEITAEADGKMVTAHSVPSDNSVRYIFSYIAKSYMDYLGVGSVKEAIQEIIDVEIEYGMESGISLEEIVNGLSTFGPAKFTVNLQYEVDYIIYAAAISDQGVVVSEASYIDFRMDVEKSDNEFEILVDEISVNEAYLHIKTKNDDPYGIAVASTSSWAGLSDEEMAQAAINAGYVTEWSGDYEGKLKSLKANTSYVVVVFGYSSSVITTPITTYYFSTVLPGDSSDLEFDFKIEDINARGAKVTVTGTPETALYFWYLKPAEMTEDQIKSEYERIIANYMSSGMITNRLDYFKFTGTRGSETSVFNKLNSDTEYRVFAIGIDETDGSYATPMVFSEPFRTLQAKDVDIIVKAVVHNYFKCDDLIEAGYEGYEQGYGMAMVDLRPTVSGTDECVEYYYYIVLTDMMDTTQYPDEYVLNDVLYSYGFHNETVVHAFVPFNKMCTLLAVGLDKDGNVGDVFRENVTFTKQGASGIDEFEPLPEYAPASSPVSKKQLMKNPAVNIEMPILL